MKRMLMDLTFMSLLVINLSTVKDRVLLAVVMRCASIKVGRPKRHTSYGLHTSSIVADERYNGDDSDDNDDGCDHYRHQPHS